MRVYDLAWLGGLLAFVPAVAHGQNLAPAAVVESSAEETPPGLAVRFDASRSFDPDDAPSPLSFEWDFGDGATAEGAVVEHAFLRVGAYRVRVTVSDGLDRAEAGLTVVVLAPPTARAPHSSGPMAGDDERLYVVAPAAGALVEITLDDLSVRRVVTVCAEPESVAVSPDGAELWVACADRSSLVRVRRADGSVRDGPRLGPALRGVVVCEGGRALASSFGQLHMIDADAGSRVTLAAEGDVRALACDGAGERAYAARFVTPWPDVEGALYRLDLEAGALLPSASLAEDRSVDSASSGGGAPNLLGALAISPSGERLWVGGLKSNTGRGLFQDGRALTPENRVRGLLAPLELPSAVDAVGARIDANDAGEVSAIALSPIGRYAYLAHSGIGAVSVYDLALADAQTRGDPGATVPTVARIDVGVSADALWLSGSRLYVRVREALELVVLDVSDPAAPTLTSRVALLDDPRPQPVARGALLFHSSRPPVHSRGGYIACASCHPGAAHDGRTWDFTQSGEGLRNTIDLRGRAGLGHGPLHWSGNFDEVQDFEGDIIFGFGGEGLAQDGAPPHPPLGAANAGRSADLDALSAYVTSLVAMPESPHEGDAAAVERGRSLFLSNAVGCAECHTPPRYTDSTLGLDRRHDVGTLRPSSGARLAGTLDGLDTPTLLGVWATAPYLHDGRAADLRAVLTTENAGDAHGRTAGLEAEEIEDLVAFLQSLDARDASAPPVSEGCSASSSARTPRGAGALALLALALWSRSRRRTIGSRRR